MLRLRKLCRMLLRRCKRCVCRCLDLEYQQMPNRHSRKRAATKLLITLMATMSACQDNGSMTTCERLFLYHIYYIYISLSNGDIQNVILNLSTTKDSGPGNNPAIFFILQVLLTFPQNHPINNPLCKKSRFWPLNA